MKWRIAIAILYVVGAVAAGTIYYTSEAKADPEGEKIVSADAANEYETKIEGLQSRLDDVCARLVKSEAEKAELKSDRDALQEEIERLNSEADARVKEEEERQAEEARLAEEEARAAEEETVASEEEEEEEAAAAEEDSADAEETLETGGSEEGGPYYTYKVNTESDPLRLYRKKTEGEQKELLPKGYRGYVISVGEKSDVRALILYKGKLYYASKAHLKLTEIDAEDYPEELSGLSEEDIGKKFFKGKAIGIEKDNRS